MSKEVLLFGKPVVLKNQGCNHGDLQGGPLPPFVNLFVKVTNGCNAHCAFCSNAGVLGTNIFDEEKLFRIIDEILQNNLIINRLNITGGEPATVAGRVNRILGRLGNIDYANIHVHLNTNGLLLSSQELMRHPRWNSISVSLHHYDIDCLSEIYGTTILPQALSFDGIDMKKVNASCNLIKGYIDSTDEAHRMMDFCLDRGYSRLGFVELMPVNNYSRSHLIQLSKLKLENIPHCYFTESRDRGHDCRCSNFLYNRNLQVLEIYMRHYSNPNYCESSLVYDGEYLRQGFHQDNIIY